jgi:aryl-alcohol dehydrogenase-like predicted oxidoreductase
MEYRTLGNSDLKVSRICMGCMGFGDPTQGQHTWTLGYDQTREIIKRGLELGVNFYDTAIIYQNGTSEQFVGKALRELCSREDVVVATKFLPRTADEIRQGITGQQHVERMLNKSLENLAWITWTCISATCGTTTRPSRKSWRA